MSADNSSAAPNLEDPKSDTGASQQGAIDLGTTVKPNSIAIRSDEGIRETYFYDSFSTVESAISGRLDSRVVLGIVVSWVKERDSLYSRIASLDKKVAVSEIERASSKKNRLVGYVLNAVGAGLFFNGIFAVSDHIAFGVQCMLLGILILGLGWFLERPEGKNDAL